MSQENAEIDSNVSWTSAVRYKALVKSVSVHKLKMSDAESVAKWVLRGTSEDEDMPQMEISWIAAHSPSLR